MADQQPSHRWIVERDQKLRDFFSLDRNIELISPELDAPGLPYGARAGVSAVHLNQVCDPSARQ